MKFAVIGGDLRSALLCSMLAGDGHRVYSFALEKAELSVKSGARQPLQAMEELVATLSLVFAPSRSGTIPGH